MVQDIILEIFNRMPIRELTERHEQEQSDYICQDGKVVKIIKVNYDQNRIYM